MELTKEQIEIINSSGNIKINAVAGSGKTTTIIEYAKARPESAKILYLAFNKSVKIEAEKKFAEKGLLNVKVETAHSLAYKKVVPRNSEKKIRDYQTHEIAELLGLQGTGEKHAVYIIANHIKKFIAYYCNSDKQTIKELNYADVVFDPSAKSFVNLNYSYIASQTRALLQKMDKGEIEITHDFYLKKFQLSNPTLHYDYILFDEAQDASTAMLDIVLKQKATKVIVGDTHQQIYAWRYAVNSLEKADYKTYYLSNSFRFNQDVANLAMKSLELKNHFIDYKPIQITGNGVSKKELTKAVIGRTNLGLLFKAIAYIIEKKKVQHIYFEGDISSYTYANDGASLYDVLSLHNGNRKAIKNKIISQMKDLKELEEYIEKTDDFELKTMLEIVNEYGNEIPKIIKEIKSKHVEKNEKEKAEIIFSTVHKCKGMEYDSIHLANDFISEDRIEKLKVIDYEKMNEEINLLYVAITRTKNMVYIPENLLPKNFPPSPNIKRITVPKEAENNDTIPNPPLQKEPQTVKVKYPTTEKAYDVAIIRMTVKNAYAPWTEDDDIQLTTLYCERTPIKKIAEKMGRTQGAIRSRIEKLELRDTYDI